MKGFVYVAVGLALIYVAISGKALDLLVAILQGTPGKLPAATPG